MKNRIKLLINKRGLTLVEIIVVLLVSSILIGIAMGMLAPTRRLMNAIKGNAHMDALCDTVNEYIRGSLQGATSVCVIPYTKIESDPVKKQWEDYTKKYTKADGYVVKALGILENYPGDFRLYDFGDVSAINYSWGTSFHLTSADENPPGTAFATLIEDRDGAGTDKGGLNHDKFHKFDVFNEEFYRNGFESGGNYGIQVAFEVQSKDISIDGEDGESSTIDGVGYLTIHTQVFKRTGNYSVDWDKTAWPITYFKDIVEVEPANQMKSLSFKLLNGTATLDHSENINSIVEKNGAKEMVLAPDLKTYFTSDATGTKHKMTQEGLVILYVVRDIDTVLAEPTP